MSKRREVNFQPLEVLLGPTGEWVDTPEQEQLRKCLLTVLTGQEDVDLIRVGHDLITLMRDQLMTGVGQVRRQAAARARDTMQPEDLARASGQSRATIARLLTEARHG